MSVSLEASIAFPVSLALLLIFAKLAFPVYEELQWQALHETREERLAEDGRDLYRPFYGDSGLPQLDSHVDRLKELMQLLEDNAALLSSALDLQSLMGEVP